jgi:L-fuculose-phosphate aldolase
MEEIRTRFAAEIEELAEATRRIGELRFVTSHGGNLSYRLDDGSVLITPTKRVKRLLTAEDIVVVDRDGTVVSAAQGRKPTGELPMHLRLYELRPDLNALVHAHPPVLTGFAISGSDVLSRPLLPEPIIEVGPVVTADYAEPISEDLARSFERVTRYSNAWLMKNHGVTVGSWEGIARALDLLEMIEAMAVSVVTAQSMGGLDELPADEVANLENTIRTRDMRFPGDPRYVTGLRQLFGMEDR